MSRTRGARGDNGEMRRVVARGGMAGRMYRRQKKVNSRNSVSSAWAFVSGRQLSSVYKCYRQCYRHTHHSLRFTYRPWEDISANSRVKWMLCLIYILLPPTVDESPREYRVMNKFACVTYLNACSHHSATQIIETASIKNFSRDVEKKKKYKVYCNENINGICTARMHFVESK